MHVIVCIIAAIEHPQHDAGMLTCQFILHNVHHHHQLSHEPSIRRLEKSQVFKKHNEAGFIEFWG